MTTKTSHPFDRREQPRKASKRPHVKFELKDPKTLRVMIVKSGQGPVYATVTEKAEIDAFLAKAHHAKDGRLQGIFIPAGRVRVPGGDRVVKDPKTSKNVTEHTPERYVQVPDAIAPQRAVLGPDGEQNIAWVANGQVHRLLIPVDAVDKLELCLLTEDIPSYRVLAKDFDPAERADM